MLKRDHSNDIGRNGTLGETVIAEPGLYAISCCSAKQLFFKILYLYYRIRLFIHIHLRLRDSFTVFYSIQSCILYLKKYVL